MTFLWMNRDAFVKWGMRICTVVILSVMALFFYWIVIDRSPPITIHSGKVVTYQEQSDGSWIIFVRWHATRHRICTGNSKRWLDAGALLPLSDIPYPPEASHLKVGEHQWEVAITLPAYFAKTDHTMGFYKIEIEYACNPAQEHGFPIIVVPDPVPFELPVKTQRN